MGTRSWSRQYIAGRSAEVAVWIDRAFRMRGFQAILQAQRLEWPTLGAVLSKACGEGCYIIAWTPARSGWCVVLGLSPDDTAETAVHMSDVIAIGGRQALDYGYLNDLYWCKYYVDGILEEEFGNAQDQPYRPWLSLIYDDPNDPRWLSARLHASQWLGQGSERRDLNFREELVLPKRLHPERGLLANAEIVRPDVRGRLGIEAPGKGAEEVIKNLGAALDLRYTGSLDLMTLQMQRRRVEAYPDYAEAFGQGVMAAIYGNPFRLTSQR